MRFSIIIPAYKSENYIANCLDSVLAQDYPQEQFEVIVVDDASPDNQDDVIEEYCSKHPNLSLIKHSVNKRQGGGGVETQVYEQLRVSGYFSLTQMTIGLERMYLLHSIN